MKIERNFFMSNGEFTNWNRLHTSLPLTLRNDCFFYFLKHWLFEKQLNAIKVFLFSDYSWGQPTQSLILKPSVAISWKRNFPFIASIKSREITENKREIFLAFHSNMNFKFYSLETFVWIWIQITKLNIFCL